jgi:DNA-3-methyladenine glycosylase
VPIAREFFARPSVEVAPDLLGCVLEHETADGLVAVELTEVEAYAGRSDPASHAYRGKTRRNAVMFGPPGHAYVYFTYGMHHCFNIVCGQKGRASAVLVRALEPVLGLEAMRRRRRAVTDAALARGPGSLARALGLDRGHDGVDLTRGPIWVSDLALERHGRGVSTGPRVGIRLAAERPWRYWVTGSTAVSAGPRALRTGSARGARARVDTLATHS